MSSIINFFKEKFYSIKTYFDGLDKRQKVIFGVSFAAGIIILMIVILSALLASAGSLEKQFQKNKQALQEITKIREEYLTLKTKSDKLEQLLSASGGKSLTTILENKASELGIKIESTQPQSAPPNDIYEETRIKVKIPKTTLKDIVEYFYKIENHESYFKISEVNMKPLWKDPAYLNITFTVSSFELKKE